MPDHMILAKDYTPKKLNFPVHVSVKLDGVAGRLVAYGHTWGMQSRQDEPLLSCGLIAKELNLSKWRPPEGTEVLGELIVNGVDNFKDAAGIIRRQKVDDRIMFCIYDYVEPSRNEPFMERIAQAKVLCDRYSINPKYIRVVEQTLLGSQEALDDLITAFDVLNPQPEGLMIRPSYSLYKKGRSWDFQRYKPSGKQTVDLRVVGFEEAENADGKPLGMVGRVLVSYNGTVIGCGPGKLTHDERKELWRQFTHLKDGATYGRIAQIQYMRDESYSALRQATFQCWRPDKSVADA